MFAIIENAVTFFFIIFLGYLFKQKKILSVEDGRKLGKVIMNVTLPCALISSVKQLELGTVMIYAILTSIIVNAIMLYVGYLYSKHRTDELRATYALNVAGYNIGNFAIPFAQYFYDTTAISYISMFDIGNSFMGLGINYCVGSLIAFRDCHQRISDIIRKLCSSIPFDTYMILFLCSLIHFEIPQVIVDVTIRIGNANTFLSMFMVGLLLDFHINQEELKDVFHILMLRIAGAIVFLMIVWFLYPLPVLAKQMIMIALLSPTMSVAPLFSYYVGYQGHMPAIVGSLSMLISIIMISTLLILFQI